MSISELCFDRAMVTILSLIGLAVVIDWLSRRVRAALSISTQPTRRSYGKIATRGIF